MNQTSDDNYMDRVWDTMLSGGKFLNQWHILDEEAKEWAESGNLVFGPGPRKWTWNQEEGGAEYVVLSHEGGEWKLKKVREW